MPEENHRIERLLLCLAVLFVLTAYIILAVIRSADFTGMWPVLLISVIAFGLHLILNKVLPNRDPVLLPIILLMSGWGIALVDRLAPGLMVRQSIWLIISSAGLLSMIVLPPDLSLLSRYRYLWLSIGILLLGATLLIGVNPSGDPFAPRLWLSFGLIYFQPSELLKLLMIIFLSSYMAEKRDLITLPGRKVLGLQMPALPYIAPMLLMWGFCMILLVWQRDLGAAALFFLVFLTMLYLATNQPVYLGLGGILLGVVAILGYFLYDVVKLRFDIFFNPWVDPSGRAYQVVQSLMAIASGGVFGQGFGQGAPLYVPVVHSDFIYAAITEEWGLFGGIAVIILLMMLFMRGIRLAQSNQKRPFHALLAAGIVISLIIQSAMIIGGVLKVFPLTGVTLPFLSYGGSSLLISFMMTGLLLRLSDMESPGVKSEYIKRWLPHHE